MSSAIAKSSCFRSVSIVIAAINETFSLRKTVEIIYETCAREDVAEIIIVVAKISSEECMATCRELEKESKVPFTILLQTRRYAGGAYQDAFELARGSHVVMMASDLETDPYSLPDMIKAAKENPECIICTSRWLDRRKFGKGYNPAKFVLNYIFQKLMRLFFHGDLTDWTFGYRLFPREVVLSTKWEELRHPFFLETILKPLRLGVPVREIPTSWEPRQEGESQNSFWRNFLYFKTVYRVFFASRASLLRQSDS